MKISQSTLDKIEEMKAQNNEFYKQKTFVDNILKYPWSTNDNFFETLNNDSNKIINYLVKNNCILVIRIIILPYTIYTIFHNTHTV
jgi:ATP-dependent Lon protease